MPDSRRHHYRVVYPIAERPTLKAGSQSFSVIECSEQGFRYAAENGGSPPVGAEVSGRLSFCSGEELEVVGEVVRLQDSLVAVFLPRPGIPFSIILLEQRYLRGKGYSPTE